MELLREFNDNGYFTSKLYHLLTKKRMVDTAEEIIPSEYEKEMEMSCADRLKNLNNMEIDNIVVTGGQKADKPVLEFTPRILVFQNYKPHQKILAKLTVKNISKAPTFLNMRCKDSLFFSVKPLSTALVSRIAPGISYTFGVTFIPRSEFEDYTHKLTFYTDIDQYVVALIEVEGKRRFGDMSKCESDHQGQDIIEFPLKRYHYQPLSPFSDDEDAVNNVMMKPNYNPLKRENRNIDAFFEKPKKSKKKSICSTVGQAHPSAEGISYISGNDNDGATASHLVKIEIFDLKKLKDIDPSEHWKYADVRVKYYAEADGDRHLQTTRDVIYNITKNIAEREDCKKFFMNFKKK